MEQVLLRIDKAGRLKIPEALLERLGIHPQESIVVEVSESGALIKPKSAEDRLTQEIAGMNLPVADWDQMKREIEGGRFA